MQRWSVVGAPGPGTAADGYRRIRMALEDMPRTGPPQDFAAQVAKQVACPSLGLDRTLYRILALLLSALSMFLIARYGGDWWSTARGALARGEIAWPTVCALCLALSWMTIQLRNLIPSHTADSGR